MPRYSDTKIRLELDAVERDRVAKIKEVLGFHSNPELVRTLIAREYIRVVGSISPTPTQK